LKNSNPNEVEINKTVVNREVLEVEKYTGMPVVIISENTVSDVELSLQVLSEKVTATDMVSIQDVAEEVTVTNSVSVSTSGQKRKYSGCTESCENDIYVTQVRKPAKKPRTTSFSNGSVHDHTYCLKSPRRVKNQVYGLVDKIENLQKKVKVSQQKTRRRNRKVSTLASVVSELKDKNLINNDCAALLETTFSGVPRELMKRLVTQKKKKNPGAYPLELRSFAMTLKFYSTKAYNYVRKSFDLGLPHVSVIRS